MEGEWKGEGEKGVKKRQGDSDGEERRKGGEGKGNIQAGRDFEHGLLAQLILALAILTLTKTLVSRSLQYAISRSSKCSSNTGFDQLYYPHYCHQLYEG